MAETARTKQCKCREDHPKPGTDVRCRSSSPQHGGGVGFKNFFQTNNPAYKVPVRSTVGKYVEAIYDETRLEVIRELKDQLVSVTTDLWTSNALQGYSR